jgi:serine/threonine-protein phosphatase 2A regulatory subunit B
MKMIVSLTNSNVSSLGTESKFRLTSQFLTGSYSNFFHVYNLSTDTDTILQADKSAFKAKRAGSTKNKPPAQSRKMSRREEYTNVDTLDFGKKIIHASWHPRENTVALAATNNLFLFQG